LERSRGNAFASSFSLSLAGSIHAQLLGAPLLTTRPVRAVCASKRAIFACHTYWRPHHRSHQFPVPNNTHWPLFAHCIALLWPSASSRNRTKRTCTLADRPGPNRCFYFSPSHTRSRLLTVALCACVQVHQNTDQKKSLLRSEATNRFTDRGQSYPMRNIKMPPKSKSFASKCRAILPNQKCDTAQ